MPEVIKPVRTVIVDYVCDACGEGFMRQNGGIAYLTDPIQTPHKCSVCGHEMLVTGPEYPRTEWREIEDKA